MTDPVSSVNQMSEADSDLSVTACDSTQVVVCDPVDTTDHASVTENLFSSDLNQDGMCPVCYKLIIFLQYVFSRVYI